MKFKTIVCCLLLVASTGCANTSNGNIDTSNRPVVHNADNTISTVLSISINVDGKEYLIPTIAPDGQVLSDEDAISMFLETGKYLGVFDTVEQANTYAKALSNKQGQIYKNR